MQIRTDEFCIYTTLVILTLFRHNPIVSCGKVHPIIKDNAKQNEKLLIIMLDGFKWDYYSQHNESMKAFTRFLSDGVQAKWVETVFPSVSFAAWTTISTGVYPETHGIIGNYIFDLNETDPTKAVFSLNIPSTTRLTKWWQNSEPIWTTATKNNKKTFLRYWSRCEVPFHGVRPQECTGYSSAPGVESIQKTFDVAVQKLKEDYELVMVYGEHIDNVGHRYGPYAPQIKEALIGVDGALNELMDNLTKSGLEDKVNIIIVSDHGMTWCAEPSGVKYVNLGDYLDVNDIRVSVEKGSYMTISPYPERLQKVYESLQGVPGIDVYKREDVPEEYHFKNSPLAHEILVVVKNNYYIRGLQSGRHIPPDKYPKGFATGVHGYAKMVDMNTIFFAKGPAFRKGIVHPPIELVDEYQIFAKLLQIPAQPHNGSWSRVADMFVAQTVTQEKLASGASVSYSQHLLPVIFNFVISFLANTFWNQ